MRARRWLAAALLTLLAGRAAAAYPVTVDSCGEKVTFDAAPVRPVANDLNMVQTLIDLGLADRFVGFSGIAGVEDHLQAPERTVAAIRAKEFSPRYPGLETILGLDPDFYFAGWGFGLGLASVTPAALADAGVKTYALAESCIKIGPRAPVSMQTVYADVLALGAIFGATTRATAMVADFRARVGAVTERIGSAPSRPRVMYCGDCDSDAPPLSMGAEGILSVLIDLAGGHNIFGDVGDSYARVSWEAVIQRDPEWIVISDQRIPIARIIDHLTMAPELANVAAVRSRQFILMSYPERSPSTRNVQALERLARALHPDLPWP